LNNFDGADADVAAFLLDKFTFYNSKLTDCLFKASYYSLSDGMPKGPQAPGRTDLVSALVDAVFTPVRGEHPNYSDSGFILCRKARQLLGVPESAIVDTADATYHADKGRTVVFVDDFIGSGDQFIKTWTSTIGRASFAEIQARSRFVAVYITLVATEFGLQKVHLSAPAVAVCAAHVLGRNSTLDGVIGGDAGLQSSVTAFLYKYAARLRPRDEHMAKTQEYLLYGYKKRKLLFAFEHSVPDATLPIFWSPGDNNWEPLIERR
jgi:hypothetical protein